MPLKLVNFRTPPALRVVYCLPYQGGLSVTFRLCSYFSTANMPYGLLVFCFASLLRKAVFVSYGYSFKYYTVDFPYIEVQGTLWNTSRYSFFDISDLRNLRIQ